MQCGGDGCGGECGNCADGTACSNGICKTITGNDNPYIVLSTFHLTPTGEFMTFLAHLYGQQVFGQVTHFVDPLTIKNPSSEKRTVVVEAELQGYSDVASTVVTLEPEEEKTLGLDLTFDFHALYAISAPVLSQARITLSDTGGTTFDSFSQSVTVLSKNTAVFAIKRPDGTISDFRKYFAVFATPHDAAGEIDRLMKESADQSTFGAMVGYQYLGQPTSQSLTLSQGTCHHWQTYYFQKHPLTGSALNARVVVTVDPCTLCDSNAIYMVMDDANYQKYQASQPYETLLHWNTLGAGDLTIALPGDGGYHHIACNPADNIRDRVFNIQRTMGANEGASDQLSSIYKALHNRGMNYSNATEDYFEGAQNVRFPSQSLAATTANCIDGTLVFASVLESLEMRPLIFIGPGHALVGVRLGPTDGGPYMALETTMVSQGDAGAAISQGLNQVNAWKGNPVFLLLDLKKLREGGVTPAPM